MADDEDNTDEEDEDGSLDIQSASSSNSLGASSKTDTEKITEGEKNSNEDREGEPDSEQIVVMKPLKPREIQEKENILREDNQTITENEDELEEDSISIDDNDNLISAQQEPKVELGKQDSYPEDSNPFGDDNDDDEKEKSQPEVDISNTNVTEDRKEESANPFGSDIESDDEETTSLKTDRTIPPQVSTSSNASQNPFGDYFSSDEDTQPLHPPSPNLSVASSSVARKKRPAPRPPARAITPGTPSSPVTPVPAPRISINKVQDVKSRKDADNINRKNELLSRSDISRKQIEAPSPMPADKAEEGQWRKKKGPAPPRPLPPKRSVKKLPRKAINQELFDIEVKQAGMELQGVKLEKSIREICSADDAKEGARDSLGPEAEDLIIQLFDLVNEKNELFRRQTELVYMKKENRLEEIHADLEYQIRVLMAKPECQRTDDDKVAEEKLIAKLMEVVSQRNFIVDCLEMDRRRELDEDTAIEDHMSSYAAVQPEEKRQIGLAKLLKRKKKKKKNKDDDEKDVDTSETKGQEEKPSKKEKSAKKKILSMTTKKLNSLNLSLKKQ